MQNKTTEEITKDFLAYCKELGYGSFEVKVIDGLPKKLTAVKQDVRFDLKTGYQDVSIK